jgi:hypothetical protein
VEEKVVGILRGCNGAIGWLANQTRPDLSVQCSLAQQGLPKALGKHHDLSSQAVRRARQYADLGLTFRVIAPEDLRICGHVDAAFDRDRDGKSQYGFVVGYCDPNLAANAPSSWSPACRKSTRVRRACSSTLAAEAQAAVDGVRHMEWMAALLAETLCEDFDLHNREQWLSRFMSCAVSDCKSLFDHCSTQTCTGSVEDKTAAIDIAVLKSHLKRLSVPLRWCETEDQIADAMTKNAADALDALRAAMRTGVVHLQAEDSIMQARAEEKEYRLAKGKARAELAAAGKGPGSGGARDFWLPSNSKHYLGKVARSHVPDEEILKVRVHQVARTRLMSAECSGFPPKGVAERRLTMLRQMLPVEDGGAPKLGPIELRWDSWSEKELDLGFSWIGATVVLKL